MLLGLFFTFPIPVFFLLPGSHMFAAWGNASSAHQFYWIRLVLLCVGCVSGGIYDFPARGCPSVVYCLRVMARLLCAGHVARVFCACAQRNCNFLHAPHCYVLLIVTSAHLLGWLVALIGHSLRIACWSL